MISPQTWVRFTSVLVAGVALFTGAFAGPKTEVTVWVGRNVAPGAKVRVNINTRNVPVVQASLYRIDGSSWLKRFDDETDKVKRPATPGAPVRKWKITVSSKEQAPKIGQSDVYYSRQTSIPLVTPGVYLMSVEGGGHEAWSVVNVTNLAIVAKRSPERLLVWVTDAKKGNVVDNAQVAVYNKAGKKVASGTTGDDGACLIPIKPGENSVVVSRGNDQAVVQATGSDEDGKLLAHFQTDRPIYRPGQTIQYRALLRRTLGQGYKALAGQSVKIEFLDAKDDLLEQVTLKASAMGTVSGSFEIPSEGMLGNYTLLLKIGDDEARESVEVAEYRKPEYQVQIAPTAKRWLAGEQATFLLDANYYFGAPVPQASVSYRVARVPLGFCSYMGDRVYDDGNLYPSDDYRGDPFVVSQTVHTDKDGKVAITFDTDAKAPDSTYTIEATVQDASRREVKVNGSVPVYAAGIRIGVRTDLLCVPLGKLIPVQIRAVDLDGKPCAARVSLTLYTKVWMENEGRYKDLVVATLTAQVPDSGKVTVNMPAKAEGSLYLRAMAKDNTGRSTQAGMGVYVVGPFEKVEKEKPEPFVSVKLDRRNYKPGDNLHAFITTNQKKRPILATLEGGDLWAYKVFSPGKGSREWTIPTSRKVCPNALVGVSMWRDLQPLSGRADFAMPDETRAITVKATPDKTDYRPGEKATYSVSTVDSEGKPIPAELTLSVVDEAIYALRADGTRDMWEFYWGAREPYVQTTTSAPEELSGGAYQKNEKPLQGFIPQAGTTRTPVAPVRKRFEDTAYWNALVQTGADGKAEVTFEMPGNLTTWNATARGVTVDTRVGMAKASVKANRDVMLRLATPRQMVQGDQIKLIGTVDNRSAEEHEFEVSLSVKDIGLVGEGVQHLKVGAKSQGKVEWTLVADKLPASGAAQLLGEVSVPGGTADMADALMVPLRVAPQGVEERLMVGGVVAHNAEAVLDVPTDRIAGAGKVTVTAWVGFRAALEAAAQDVLDSYRYGSVGAADHLEVAAAQGMSKYQKEVRETLAFLAKTQSSGGWGWWENSPPTPVITARVMAAIGHASEAGIESYERMAKNGRANLVDLYKRTNLWEFRALLASSAALTGEKTAPEMLNEVIANGESMSPYARLSMAEALAFMGRKDDANKLIEDALKDASEGPDSAFLPCGEGTGWSATQIETTAQALATLIRTGQKPELQAKLARWLVTPGEYWWRCGSEDAAVTRALTMYLKVHREATTLGPIEIEVAGHKVTAIPAKVGAGATAEIPIEWLSTGKNTFTLKRPELGEALFKVEARVFRPGLFENSKGVRVLRRFEVRNPAGVWEELNRTVKTSEPVRCTVLIWGDDLDDALRVVEPIPSGFEFIENDYGYGGRSEVRDAAVVHYLINAAAPQVFRFYIRAESEGKLVALPATAEYVRRPANRGQSVGLPIDVKAGK